MQQTNTILTSTCLVGAGPDGKHTALEAVTIVLDLPPPQPGSMLGLTSVDRVSASDPKSALALQRLVQADSRNPTLAGALTRLQRCAFSGSWEVLASTSVSAIYRFNTSFQPAFTSIGLPVLRVIMIYSGMISKALGQWAMAFRPATLGIYTHEHTNLLTVRIIAAQALATMAIRSGEPFRLQIYEFLHMLAQGGVQSQFSEMHLSNGEDQGASGTGLGVLINPMIEVLDEMNRAQDDLINAKLIDMYHTRHNISASTGLSDPAVAIGISDDLIYESKPAAEESDMLDDDLVNAWAANLGDDGLLGNNAPAMRRVTS
ncbi:unnamed protein product [Prunus armeniaca]